MEFFKDAFFDLRYKLLFPALHRFKVAQLKNLGFVPQLFASGHFAAFAKTVIHLV